jgi:hypothetical protein
MNVEFDELADQVSKSLTRVGTEIHVRIELQHSHLKFSSTYLQ